MGKATETQEKHSHADDLFRKAFELERQAAESVANSYKIEPSRSILLLSAASLALDCRDFQEAERLIAIGLSGKNVPDELCEEFRELLEKVHFEQKLQPQG